VSAYLILKLLHVLAAFWFIAGILGRQLVRSLARGRDDVHEVASLSATAGKFELLMVIPGNLVVIVLGIVLAWVGGWPIFGFLQGAKSNWLLVSNLILLGGIFLVPMIYLPKGKVFDRVLQDALSTGEITPKLKAVLDDRVVKWAHRVESAGMLAIIVLMVLKPF
jgi:uncharacterized membrane protein